MSFDPLAAAATAILVVLVLAAHAAYRHIHARLSEVWRSGYQAGYDAGRQPHGLTPLPKEATWRTDN